MGSGCGFIVEYGYPASVVTPMQILLHSRDIDFGLLREGDIRGCKGGNPDGNIGRRQEKSRFKGLQSKTIILPAFSQLSVSVREELCVGHVSPQESTTRPKPYPKRTSFPPYR